MRGYSYRHSAIVWRPVCLILIAAMSLSLNGCAEFLRSPMEMIRRPRLEINQERALEVIQQSINADAVLISPLISDDLSSVNMIDIDNDDVKEVVAFYSMKNSFRIGFIILERNDEGFYVSAKLDDIGQDLIYAKIGNFSGQGRMSLIMGLQGAKGTLKNLSVYSYQNAEYRQTYRGEYTQLLIGDFDKDAREEIFVLDTTQDNEATATVLKEHGGIVSTMDILSLDPYIKSYDSVMLADVAKGKRAIVLDFSLGTTLFATDILLFDDLKLKPLFYQKNSILKYEKTLKSTYIQSQDIDGDGVVEIGKSIASTLVADPAISPLSLTGWYKWDGRDGLMLLKSTFDDPKGVYRFSFPSRWKADVTLRGTERSRDIQSVQFILTLEPGLAFPVFEIIQVPSSQFNAYREGLAEREVVYYILGRAEGMVYLGLHEVHRQDVPEEYRTQYLNMTLTDSEIRENFIILNQ